MKKKIFIWSLMTILILLAGIIIWSAVVPKIGPSNDYQKRYQNTICLNDKILEILDTNFSCIENETVSLNIEKGPYFFNITKIKILPSNEIFILPEIGANEARTIKLKENYKTQNITIIPLLELDGKETQCLPSSINLKNCN